MLYLLLSSIRLYYKTIIETCFGSVPDARSRRDLRWVKSCGSPCLCNLHHCDNGSARDLNINIRIININIPRL